MRQPHEELLRGELSFEHGEQRRRDEVGGRGAELHEAGDESAAFRGRGLRGEQHGPALLTADAEALNEPHDQQDRGPDADLLVRGQQADRDAEARSAAG